MGEKHPNTLHVLYNIANLTTPETESIKKHREVLELRKEYLGEQDAAVAQSYYSLGCLLMERNSIEARKFLELSIEIEKSIYGEYDEVIAQSYKALGSLDRHKNHFKRSLTYYLRAYKIYEKIKDQISEEKMYSIHFEVGLAYYHLKQYKDAISSLTTALAIAENEYGPQSNECKMALENIGHCYQEDNKLEDALPFFLKAHEIESAFDQNILSSFIVEIYNKLENYPKAERYSKSAIEYHESHYGETFFGTAVTYHNYGAILKNQRKYSQAEKQYRKAIAAIEANEKIPQDNRFYATIQTVLNSMYNHYSSMPKTKNNKETIDRINNLLKKHYSH